jgi:flavodoxin
MKIGIIVHSQTGNTYSVAQKLKEKLLTAGHTVNIERVIPVDDKQIEVEKIQLNPIPDISTYDALIFGAPVRGASVSPALAAYIAKTASLRNKKVACFVTEFFPFPWMGGTRAIDQMKKACESKGAVISGTGIVNWMNTLREKKIADMVENLSGLF